MATDATRMSGTPPAEARPPNLASRFAGWVETINRIASYLATIAIGLMMVGTAIDVILRSLFNRPILGVTEVNEFLMVFTIYLGLAYTQVKKGHVRVELFLMSLPPVVQVILDILVYVITLIVFGLVLQATFAEAARSIEINEYRFGTIRFPIYPARIMVVLGIVLLALQLVIDLVRDILKLIDYFSGKTIEGTVIDPLAAIEIEGTVIDPDRPEKE